MEFSIRYVRINDETERPVLGLRGSKQAHCVVNDLDRIHTVSIPIKDFDKSSLTMLHGEPYPVTRYLKEIEEYKKKRPISEKADHILSLAYAGKPEAIDEDSLAALSEDLARQEEVPDPEIPHPSAAADPLREKPAKAKIPRPPLAALPAKAKAPGKSPPKRGRGRPRGSTGTLIARLAAELKAEQPHLRKACRAAGMSAPYTDEKSIRAAWKKHGR